MKTAKEMFEFYDESEFEEWYYAQEQNCFIVFKQLTKEYYKVDKNNKRRAINGIELVQ